MSRKHDAEMIARIDATKKDYPIGTALLFSDCDNLPRWGTVTGYTLNMAYQVLIKTSGGVCYRSEVRRVLDDHELKLLDTTFEYSFNASFSAIRELFDGYYAEEADYED